MQNRTEKFALCRKSITYLAKIAVILQAAPSKMLTFSQLMDRLAPLICEDRKSVENNIRVCLSTHSCFVKIPVVSDSLRSKRNFWKLDPAQITAKMVRRHFKGILQLFPELACKVETEETKHSSDLHPHIARESKFSSSFSIESLLKRDGPSAPSPRPSPLCGVSLQQQLRLVRTKGSLDWDPEELRASARGSPVWPAGGSAHHGLSAKRLHVSTEASLPMFTRAAPYFSSTQSNYITYSVPAFTHDALCFRL